MTEPIEKKQRDRIHRNQIIASFIANLTLLAAGLCYSWTTVTLPKLNDKRSNFHLTSDKEALVAIALPIGSCVGPILSALLLDRIGRKWFLYMTAIPFIICWILVYLAKTWVLLFVGMLIAGMSVGALFAAIPIYLGEIMQTKVRGAASAMIPLLFNVGYLFNYGVGPLLGTKVLALASLAPSIVFLLTFLWMPESPYYYLKKQKVEHAKLSLTWLRGKLDNGKELEEMRTLIEAEQQGSIKELYTVPAHRKAFLILLLLLTGQQLSGFLAIQTYVGFLLERVPIKLTIETMFIILGGINLLVSALSALVVDRLGRKPVFLISSYIAAVCLFVVGTYFLLLAIGMDIKQFSLLPFCAIVVYYACFTFGLSPIPSIISSEIFPISLKTWGTAFAHAYGAVLSLIVMKSYQLASDSLGNYVVFYAFGVIELAIAIAASVVMPETSRKSFMEIGTILKGNMTKETPKWNVDETEKKAATSGTVTEIA